MQICGYLHVRACAFINMRVRGWMCSCVYMCVRVSCLIVWVCECERVGEIMRVWALGCKYMCIPPFLDIRNSSMASCSGHWQMIASDMDKEESIKMRFLNSKGKWKKHTHILEQKWKFHRQIKKKKGEKKKIVTVWRTNGLDKICTVIMNGFTAVCNILS